MGEVADYFGSWLLREDIEHTNALGAQLDYEFPKLIFWHGLFKFFIDERERLNNLEEMIKGRIYDSLGEASFDGRLVRGFGKDTIEFVKRYSKEVVNSGLTLDQIPYFGEGKIETGFLGYYFMKKTQYNTVEWKGKFFMKKLPLRI